MKGKIVLSMLLIILAFNIAFIMNTFFLSKDLLAVDAWAWCTPPCGGCGMVGMDIAQCGAWDCLECWCQGRIEGQNNIVWSVRCPGAEPE